MGIKIGVLQFAPSFDQFAIGTGQVVTEQDKVGGGSERLGGSANFLYY